MTNVIIRGKKYNVFEVFNTKQEAFGRQKTISNNSSVYKTDNNKYALFLRTADVTNKF